MICNALYCCIANIFQHQFSLNSWVGSSQSDSSERGTVRSCSAIVGMQKDPLNVKNKMLGCRNKRLWPFLLQTIHICSSLKVYFLMRGYRLQCLSASLFSVSQAFAYHGERMRSSNIETSFINFAELHFRSPNA